MCEHCQNINVYVRSRNIDPTNTVSLRSAFVTEMRRRFRNIKKAINDAVITQDVFGLQVNVHPPRKAFSFPTSQDKVDAFMEWIRQLIAEELLTVKYMQQIGGAKNVSWMDMYIADSYKRGLTRARMEMKNAGYDILSMEQTGGVNASFNTPFHMDRVGMLYSRVYSDLKGITSAMDTQISRILSQGMIDGEGPRTIARQLNQVIDGTGNTLEITDKLGRFIPAQRRAEILARTETVRAYHQANIQEMKNWGVEGVNVQAEWSTAEDNRVCPECKKMATDEAGNIITYTLDEIMNLIPKHPQCRCLALPMQASDSTPNKKVIAKQPKEKKIKEIIPLPKYIPTTDAEQLKYLQENWKIDYQGIKDAGLDMSDVINIMHGFNFRQVDNELKTYLEKYNMDMKMIKPFLTIDFSGFDDAIQCIWKNKDFELVRTFYNNRTVIHEKFKIKKEFQNNGFSKDILRTFYPQYKNMNIDSINLTANLNIGGYAWGKYGFTTDKVSAEILLIDVKPNIKKKAQKILDDYYADEDYNKPFPMNLWADAEFGKKLLLKSYWEGMLRLDDSIQTQRFLDYMTQQKQNKPK